MVITSQEWSQSIYKAIISKAETSRAKDPSQVHKYLGEIKRLELVSRLVNNGKSGFDLNPSAHEIFRRVQDINGPGMHAMISEFADEKSRANGAVVQFEVLYKLAGKHQILASLMASVVGVRQNFAATPSMVATVTDVTPVGRSTVWSRNNRKG